MLLTAANVFVFLAYGTTSIVARQLGAGPGPVRSPPASTASGSPSPRRRDHRRRRGDAGPLCGVRRLRRRARPGGDLPADRRARHAGDARRPRHDRGTARAPGHPDADGRLSPRLLREHRPQPPARLRPRLGDRRLGLGDGHRPDRDGRWASSSAPRPVCRAGARALRAHPGRVLAAARTGMPLLVRTLACARSSSPRRGWRPVSGTCRWPRTRSPRPCGASSPSPSTRSPSPGRPSPGAPSAPATWRGPGPRRPSCCGGGCSAGSGSCCSSCSSGRACRVCSPRTPPSGRSSWAPCSSSPSQPLSGFVFVIDGVLIGAGDGRWLAGAMLVTLAAYLPLVLGVRAMGDWLLSPSHDPVAGQTHALDLAVARLRRRSWRCAVRCSGCGCAPTGGWSSAPPADVPSDPEDDGAAGPPHDRDGARAGRHRVRRPRPRPRARVAGRHEPPSACRYAAPTPPKYIDSSPWSVLGRPELGEWPGDLRVALVLDDGATAASNRTWTRGAVIACWRSAS